MVKLTNLKQLALSGNKLTGQCFGTFNLTSFFSKRCLPVKCKSKQCLPVFDAIFFGFHVGLTGVEAARAHLEKHLPSCNIFI
jgi:hypothetical protein